MPFPVTPSQARGTERKLGTRTAFGAEGAWSELMESLDHNVLDLRAMTGSSAGLKGTALFPRRIGGRSAMLGRQDDEDIWLTISDSLTRWDGGERIVGPEHFGNTSRWAIAARRSKSRRAGWC